MKEKIYDPARHNENAPAEGMAAVNTFMPEETPIEEAVSNEQEREEPKQPASTGNEEDK